MAVAAFLLCSLWREYLSVPVEDEEFELTNLQDFKVVKRIEDTPNGLDGLV